MAREVGGRVGFDGGLLKWILERRHFRLTFVDEWYVGGERLLTD